MAARRLRQLGMRHIEADCRGMPAVVDIVVRRIVHLPGRQLLAKRFLGLPGRGHDHGLVEKRLPHGLEAEILLHLAGEALRLLAPLWRASRSKFR